LAMYSYLINGSIKGSVVRESQLEFLESDPENPDALYSTNITEEYIDLLKRDISDYDESLKNGTWIDRPCNAKLYGSASVCEHCALAEQIYK